MRSIMSMSGANRLCNGSMRYESGSFTPWRSSASRSLRSTKLSAACPRLPDLADVDGADTLRSDVQDRTAGGFPSSSSSSHHPVVAARSSSGTRVKSTTAISHLRPDCRPLSGYAVRSRQRCVRRERQPATSARANSRGSNGPQVVETLPHADELHRQAELVGDRDRDPALGRAVELRQRDAGDAGRLAEEARLLEAVLARRRVDDEQRLVRRALDAGPRSRGAPWRAPPSGSTACGGGRPCR